MVTVTSVLSGFSPLERSVTVTRLTAVAGLMISLQLLGVVVVRASRRSTRNTLEALWNST